MAARMRVTGASGFVGTTLVPLLLQQQYQLRVVTRNTSKPQPWLSQVEIVEGDLIDAAVCSNAVIGVDAVVHLAGLAHVSASEYEHKLQNFVVTKQLAQAAQQAGVQTFIYLSSCKAKNSLTTTWPISTQRGS